MTEPNPKFTPKTMESLRFSLDFGFIIVIPLLAGVYGGKWLDQKMSTDYFVLIGIFLALFSSGYLIYKHIKKLNKLK